MYLCAKYCFFLFVLRLKPVKVRVIQQPPWPEIHAAGQSVAHPSVRQFQDRCDDSLDQVGYARSQGRRLKEFQIR